MREDFFDRQQDAAVHRHMSCRPGAVLNTHFLSSSSASHMSATFCILDRLRASLKYSYAFSVSMKENHRSSRRICSRLQVGIVCIARSVPCACISSNEDSANLASQQAVYVTLRAGLSFCTFSMPRLPDGTFKEILTPNIS